MDASDSSTTAILANNLSNKQMNINVRRIRTVLYAITPSVLNKYTGRVWSAFVRILFSNESLYDMRYGNGLFVCLSLLNLEMCVVGTERLDEFGLNLNEQDLTYLYTITALSTLVDEKRQDFRMRNNSRYHSCPTNCIREKKSILWGYWWWCHVSIIN